MEEWFARAADTLSLSMTRRTEHERLLAAAWAAAGVAAGDRVLLVVEDAVTGEVVGTVQVVHATSENQPHRGEVAKLLVRRSARGAGVGGRLMHAVETAAREAGKTLLVLDTVTGSTAERLYARLGWTRVDVVPNYALLPDGTPCDTTIFYKSL